ncbi:MAG: hypothetical protein AABM67_22040 [Acidobacteriota bacterium]
MLALLLDVAPGVGGKELIAIIALVILVISVVTVVALATGVFIFIRLRQSRAAADAVRDAWAAPLSPSSSAPGPESTGSAPG